MSPHAPPLDRREGFLEKEGGSARSREGWLHRMTAEVLYNIDRKTWLREVKPLDQSHTAWGVAGLGFRAGEGPDSSRALHAIQQDDLGWRLPLSSLARGVTVVATRDTSRLSRGRPRHSFLWWGPRQAGLAPSSRGAPGSGG